MSDMPKEIWAEQDGDDIIIHNNSPDLEGLIATGYLSHYTRTDTLPTWQPIETAPRDGTFVILARLYELDGEPMSVVTFGHWTDGYDDGPDGMGMNSGWEDHHYSEFDPGRDFGNPSYMREPRQPTHWMPLPPAPKGPTHD